jgi:hypothetical protein
VRPLRHLVAALLLATGLAGCGSEDGLDDPVLEVTVRAGKVSPRDQQLAIPAGVPIEVRITADRPGELHVHSRPSRTISFVPGTTSGEVRIDAPGVVKVEEHLSGIVVAQIEMR